MDTILRWYNSKTKCLRFSGTPCSIINKVDPVNAYNQTSLINLMQQVLSEENKVTIPIWAKLGPAEFKLVSKIGH